LDFDDEQVVGGQIHASMDLHRLANILHRRVLDTGATMLVIDPIGVGAGVYDVVRAMAGDSYRVIAFNAAEKADDDTKFYNRRAEGWWLAAEALSEGEVDWDEAVFDAIDPEFRTQATTELCAVHYGFRNGRIVVEAKDDIKDGDRLGRSPDLADTLVMGLWAVRSGRVHPTTPTGKRPSGYGRKRARRGSAMAS